MSYDYYHVLGYRALLRSTSAEFAGRARRLLRSFFLTSSGEPVHDQPMDVTLSAIVAPPPKNPSLRPFHFAYRDYGYSGKGTTFWELFRLLHWQLDAFLANANPVNLLLHSGAVSRNGQGIILPADSGSGKSTLTLALMQRGYHYLSDEFAAVDPESGELQPFPKPLSIKNTQVFPELAAQQELWLGPESNEKTRELPVWFGHPEDLRPGCLGGPVPVRYIIFPRYDAEAQPGLEPLSAGQGMQRLLANSVNFTQFGGGGLHILGNLLEGAQCFALTSNDLDATTALIDELVG